MFGLSKLALVGIALAAVVALLVVGYFSDPFGWRKNLKARVVVAEQGTELAHETGAITERVLRSEVTIHTVTERQVDAVQSAPGADAQLDPAFVDSLRASISVMRGESQAADDHNPAGTP